MPDDVDGVGDRISGVVCLEGVDALGTGVTRAAGGAGAFVARVCLVIGNVQADTFADDF